MGDDFGTDTYKWKGGCLATDGGIYCIPGNAQRIIAIYRLKEHALTLKKNMDKHPEKLRCIFQPSDDIPHVNWIDKGRGKHIIITGMQGKNIFTQELA